MQGSMATSQRTDAPFMMMSAVLQQNHQNKFEARARWSGMCMCKSWLSLKYKILGNVIAQTAIIFAHTPAAVLAGFKFASALTSDALQELSIRDEEVFLKYEWPSYPMKASMPSPGACSAFHRLILVL